MEVGAGKSGGGDIIRAMLDAEVKRAINAARDTLVGQVPDPLGQVRHITAALMHRFMSDRDRASVRQGGKPAFFIGEFAPFAWDNILNPQIGGHRRAELYREAVEKMADNRNLPAVFREMFRGAFVAFNDPQTITLFLQEINNLPARDGEDLGNAFEFLLSVMGTQGAAGQFRTPRHIIEFIVEVAAPQNGERILDPACGTAGFLIAAHQRILRENASAFNPRKHQFAFAAGRQSADALRDHGQFRGDKLQPHQRRKLDQNIHGYDISPDMIRLSRVNLFLHGVRQPQIRQYDTLTSQDRWEDDFEVILANPPFMSPKGGIQPHGQFSVPSTRSEVLFADYILRHLTFRGRAGIIVPEGIIFQSGRAHKALRKNLVENGLHAVVSLPNGIFNPYSGVKTSILFVNRPQARRSGEILFVRVENDGYGLGAQRLPIDENDLPAAFELLRDWNNGIKTKSSPLAHLWVGRESLAADGEYNLTGERHRRVVVGAKAKWPKAALGKICEIVKDKPKPFSGEKRYYDTGAIATHARGECRSVSFESRPSRADILPQKGDAGFAVMKNTAKVVLIDDFYNGAIFSTGFCFLRPSEKILPHFLFQLMADERFQREKDRMAVDGIMGGVRKSHVARLEIPLPPLEFQRALAAELDGYQRVIDGARQAAENWRPQVPANPDWPLVKLGEVSKVRKGDSITKTGTTFGEIPVVAGGQKPAYYHSKSNRLGSVVTVSGSGAYAGFVNYFEQPIFASDCTTVEPLDEKAVPQFVYYMMKGKQEEIYQMQSGAGQPHVYAKDIARFQIPLPPLETQREIVSSLESERGLVGSCRELVRVHEGKIRERVGAVWGE